jgi:hypothetical protein
MLFSECYDNFVDLVLEGLTPRLWNATILAERPENMTCPERAWASILGVRDFSYHEWYNYEYYWTALQTHYSRLFHFTNGDEHETQPSLLLLRTEHLQEDWAHLSKEDLFRQVNRGSRGKNGTIEAGNAAFIGNRSSAFWRNLCHAMCPEIQTYKQILQYGRNLNDAQVQESIREVQLLCPEEGHSIHECPGIPQFPLIRVPRRQFKMEVKKRLFTTSR